MKPRILPTHNTFRYLLTRGRAACSSSSGSVKDFLILGLLLAFVFQSLYIGSLQCAARSSLLPRPSETRNSENVPELLLPVLSPSSRTPPSLPTSSTKFTPWYKNTTLVLQPKAFPLYAHKFPCYLVDPNKERWFGPKVLDTPVDRGFFFCKTWKTGSSTSVGVHLRLAYQVAAAVSRQKKKQNATTTPSLCQTRFEHKPGSFFEDRKTSKSFLWTIVRDPTQRMLSQFFHFEVGRHKKDPYDEHFLQLTETWYWMQHYAGYASVQRRHVRYPRKRAQNLFQEYDFIAVTERFDESMVALAMILNRPVTDVLYFKAKGQGGYDDGGGRGPVKQCTYIFPPFVSTTLEEYFRTDDWQDKVYWDHQVYMAANKSLDLTIQGLGEVRFQQQLLKYRTLQQKIHEYCKEKVLFPCSPSGAFVSNTGCLYGDSGCGNDCINEYLNKNPVE